MSARSKGQRVFRKAVRFALSYPQTVVLPLYQVSRWAAPQPCDMIVLREDYAPRFVEVRSNAWRTGRASTVELAKLPGLALHKQIWMLPDYCTVPKIRQWDGAAWVIKDHPFAE